MIQDRLDKIEERLKQSQAVKESDKVELLNLLKTLRTEITDLSKTRHEQAESIAGFAELSAREATRREKNPELFNLSLDRSDFIGSGLRNISSTVSGDY